MTEERVFCPYCDRFQAPSQRTDALWRCAGCHLYLSDAWLVDASPDWALDDAREVLCPWCGYPAGLRQDFAGAPSLACGGCAGTLSADMLVSQAALAVDRHQGHRFRNRILVVLFLAVVLGFLGSVTC